VTEIECPPFLEEGQYFVREGVDLHHDEIQIWDSPLECERGQLAPNMDDARERLIAITKKLEQIKEYL